MGLRTCFAVRQTTSISSRTLRLWAGGWMRWNASAGLERMRSRSKIRVFSWTFQGMLPTKKIVSMWRGLSSVISISWEFPPTSRLEWQRVFWCFLNSAQWKLVDIQKLSWCKGHFSNSVGFTGIWQANIHENGFYWLGLHPANITRGAVSVWEHIFGLHKLRRFQWPAGGANLLYRVDKFSRLVNEMLNFGHLQSCGTWSHEHPGLPMGSTGSNLKGHPSAGADLFGGERCGSVAVAVWFYGHWHKWLLP